MHMLENIFESNRNWAKRIKEVDPDFFTKLSQQQNPEFLWIGCSDSRVPANQIAGMLPGEIFVHRNIANLVIHTDLNCLSVIQFAVEVLKVKHVIVCGHYGCGGIKAAMDDVDHGLIDNWLRNIQDTYRYHQQKLDAVEDQRERQDLLCELNVVGQVANVCRTNIVRNAWESGQELAIHGWIYSIEDGILKDLNVSIAGLDQIARAEKMEHKFIQLDE